MMRYNINGFNEFCAALDDAGFTIGSGRDEGVFSIIPFSWGETPSYETKLRWHTGDPDTDPWEWRLRVLDERSDIAYAKMFFRKSGYVTKKWYPYFLSARRGGASLDERYSDGYITREAKRIFEAIRENNVLAVQDIKRIAGFNREDKSRFDRALIELQMGMFVTMCGHSRSVTLSGEEYGWNAMLYCTTEMFFGEAVFEQAAAVSKDDAYEAILRQIVRLNPEADLKKAKRFILG